MNATTESRWSSLPEYVKEASYSHDGYVLPKVVSQKYLPGLKDFPVRQDDIFLLTYPKSGTSWTLQIVSLVLDNGKEDSEVHLFKKSSLIENAKGGNVTADVPANYMLAEKMPSPRLLKSHVHIQFLPRELFEKKPKIIYVARNPKDNAVSYFNFCSFSRNYPPYTEWGEFFRDFSKGNEPFGPWFEHVLTWWKRRHDPNVLFLKYEDMKRDLRGSVVKIADFLDRPLSNQVIDTITEKCSFEAMKKNPKTNPDFVIPAFIEKAKQNKSFMRKGTVGDWKNYFTVSQNEEFDEIYRKMMEGSGLTFDFALEEKPSQIFTNGI